MADVAAIGDPVDLNSVLRSEIASDIRADGRAHTRYLHVLDRVYLSEYTEQTGGFGEKAGQIQAGSHIPVSQPWGLPPGMKMVPA